MNLKFRLALFFAASIISCMLRNANDAGSRQSLSASLTPDEADGLDRQVTNPNEQLTALLPGVEHID